MPAEDHRREGARMAIDTKERLEDWDQPEPWGHLDAYDGQMLLRGVVIALYVTFFTGNEWVWTGMLAAGTASAGIGLIVAGGLGLVSLFQQRAHLGRLLLRMADGVLDLLFGITLVALAFTTPLSGVTVFGIWAALAGLLLIGHALPSRLREDTPAWAWVWTGLAVAITGVAALTYVNFPNFNVALFLNAFALAAGALSCLLGFGIGYPYVLALPIMDSSGETMFAYDDVHWRITPPELLQHDLGERIAVEKPAEETKAA
jgi:uncharacterized membrane protein HdeD (DUF308 family)